MVSSQHKIHCCEDVASGDSFLSALETNEDRNAVFAIFCLSFETVDIAITLNYNVSHVYSSPCVEVAGNGLEMGKQWKTLLRHKPEMSKHTCCTSLDEKSRTPSRAKTQQWRRLIITLCWQRSNIQKHSDGRIQCLSTHQSRTPTSPHLKLRRLRYESMYQSSESR